MEDHAGLARLLEKMLAAAGYSMDLARDGEEGLAMWAAGSYDLLLVDHTMPVRDGMDVIRTLAAQGPLPPTIMVTGTGNEEMAVEAMKLGADDYVVKGAQGGYLDLLPTVVEQVLGRRRVAAEKERAEEALRQAYDKLEARVRERTAELEQTNKRLSWEVADRVRAEVQRDAALQTLRQHAAELQARNEDLDAFAHTVAHDLKEPLAAFIGSLQMLEQDYAAMPEEELGRRLHRVAQIGSKMSNIVDELLLLSGVRQMSAQPEPLDMAETVAEAQDRLAFLVEGAGAEIVLPESWPVVLGYGPWVTEVWVNYISNALRYGGRPPRVELGFDITSAAVTDPRESPPGSSTAFLWVRDNGPGLTPEEQARMFTGSERLDQVRARGHGLGLSIVRRIVEKLGGQVGVKSRLGSGSVFYFTLPLPAVAGPVRRQHR